MSQYILDTNIVSNLQVDSVNGSKILEKLKSLNEEDDLLLFF